MGTRSRPVLAGLLMICALSALSCGGARGQSDAISVDFGFVPAKSTYCPGDDFSIEMTVVNLLASGDYVYDSLAYMVKVMNVSVHFYWMAPNEWAWNNVSANSTWLAPDGAGTETYSVNLSVPGDACTQVYSYYFRVQYLVHTAWGNWTYTWGTGTTYKDFSVTVPDEGTADDAAVPVDYMPYLVLVAIVLSVGALGAVLYGRYGAGTEALGSGGAAGGPGSSGQVVPIVRQAPGQIVQVEDGFVYLVKELRPDIVFEMYDEAIAAGAKGMLISREHPNRLKETHDFDAESIIWLTRKVGKNHIDPTELSLVTHRITRFAEDHDRAVVLIEGMEYLITQNDFETVLRFVNHLHDFVLVQDCAVLFVVDPRVLSTREIALLERSTKVVEPWGPLTDVAPEAPAAEPEGMSADGRHTKLA